MKILKRILIGTVLIILFGGILSVTHSSIQLDNSILINTGAERAYSSISDFSQFSKWSPFLVSDPQQKNWTTGMNGAVGSRFHWKSVAEEGEGFQELVEADPNNSVRIRCTITKPFESSPEFLYTISETKENTLKIKQSFKMQCSAMDKLMMSIFGITSEIDETNRLGLNRLKQLLEK